MSKAGTYIENIFEGLPRTRQVLREKEQLCRQAEGRYDQLLAQGKNADEALGIVVAENDDLQALRQKLGLAPGAAAKERLQAEYEHFVTRYAVGISVGAALCILALCALILLTELMGQGSGLPGIVFFLLLAAGGGLCAFFGQRNGHYLARLQAAGFGQEELRRHRRAVLCDRLCNAIMALAAGAFVLLGLLGYWHPGWVALPVGGVICTVVWIALGSPRGQADEPG